MPVTDYNHIAKVAEKRIFSDKEISEINKKSLHRYLLQYKVKPATKHKFLSHVFHFLRDSENIEQDMHDRDKINKIFNKYNKKYKQVQYQMIASCSKQLVKWLNDNSVPKGFLDISLKKKQLRNLEREDMFTWAEIENLINHANRPMLKAIIALQADAGLRPSEFMDLKYKDIELDKVDTEYINIFVRDGKTGRRDVPCIRCTSYISAWLKLHPTKNAEDSLWIREYQGKHVPYTYNAIRKMIKDLCTRLNIKKPYDFYSLRHTSCYLDKIERVDPDVSADRHGHSVNHFLYVYGRLDKQDKINMFKKTTGGKEKEKINSDYSVIKCFKCDTINTAKNDYCDKCNSPLKVDVALKSQQKTNDELKMMRERMNKLEQALHIIETAKKGQLKK